MTAVISSNPFQTTNGFGSFNVQSIGLIQGTAYDSPNSRYNLAGGWLSDAETIPMFGGVGISEYIPGASNKPDVSLGAEIKRATNLTANTAGELTGFSVFDQNYNGVITPSSNVPLIPSFGSVHYYRLGSGARIAVACSPNLANLESGIITQKVSWDFVNQQLEPYVSTTLSALVSYTSGTGVVIITTAAPHGLLPGDTFEINTVAGTGADLAVLNGEHTAITGTTGSTLVFAVATGLTISTVSGGNLVSGGALDVEVLELQIGNSMTVSYDSGTNTANWNRSGNCAIILL